MVFIPKEERIIEVEMGITIIGDIPVARLPSFTLSPHENWLFRKLSLCFFFKVFKERHKQSWIAKFH